MKKLLVIIAGVLVTAACGTKSNSSAVESARSNGSGNEGYELSLSAGGLWFHETAELTQDGQLLANIICQTQQFVDASVRTCKNDSYSIEFTTSAVPAFITATLSFPSTDKPSIQLTCKRAAQVAPIGNDTMHTELNCK